MAIICGNALWGRRGDKFICPLLYPIMHCASASDAVAIRSIVSNRKELSFKLPCSYLERSNKGRCEGITATSHKIMKLSSNSTEYKLKSHHLLDKGFLLQLSCYNYCNYLTTWWFRQNCCFWTSFVLDGFYRIRWVLCQFLLRQKVYIKSKLILGQRLFKLRQFFRPTHMWVNA